jgi:hypothetical protein
MWARIASITSRSRSRISQIFSTAIRQRAAPSPLARQTENPFGSLIAIYLVGEAEGVRVKLPGEIALDPATGRLVTTFDNTPQVPFSDFKLNFFGGPSAVLATPVTCGTQGSSAVLTPWSGGPARRRFEQFGHAGPLDLGTVNDRCGSTCARSGSC